MTDVLSHGPDRPPSGTRRWFFLVAGAVIVLAAVVMPRVAGDRHTPTVSPSPAATSTSPAPTPVLAGVPAAGPLGFRLLAAGGPRLQVVTAGGAVDEVTLPGLDSSHVVRELLRVDGGTVIVARPADGATPGTMYFLRDEAAQPSLLGLADSVFPAAQPGRVYTLTWKGRTARLAEVDLDGREQWSRTLPGATSTGVNRSPPVRVVRGVAGGLLIRYDEDPGNGLVGDEIRVVHPRSGRVLRRLGSVGQVVAASAEHLVATCAPRELRELEASPDLPCKLIHLDLRSGARRDYALPDERGPGAGTLSPDGHLLAVPFAGTGPGIERLESGVVRVLDLRTGAWMQVPGVTTPFLDEQPHLTWGGPGGEWLAVGVTWPDHKKLAYWQIGSAQLHLQRQPLPGARDQALPSAALVALPG